MLYILIGVFCNVLLFVIIKGFARFGIPAIQGIIINYFVAGATALFFIPGKLHPQDFFHSGWLHISIPLGALFITIFYLISVTAEKIGIAVASVANKMSLAIPVLVAFRLYGDTASGIKIAGLALALLAVYLTIRPPGKIEGPLHERKSVFMLLLPVLVFIGSGIIDSLVNYAQKYYLPEPSDTARFIAFSFFVAGTIGVIIITTLILLKRVKFVPKSILGGIVLGVPNYFSIYFVMLAIQSSGLQSSVIYPIVNIGVVLGSAIGGVLIFREKLSRWNYAGIFLSVVAIVMIAELWKGWMNG